MTGTFFTLPWTLLRQSEGVKLFTNGQSEGIKDTHSDNAFLMSECFCNFVIWKVSAFFSLVIWKKTCYFILFCVLLRHLECIKHGFVNNTSICAFERIF